MWSSSLVAGVRFCLRTASAVSPGPGCDVGLTTSPFHLLTLAASFLPEIWTTLFFKKFNKTFSSEAGIKLIFSESLGGYHLTHTYCGLTQCHTEQKLLRMRKQSRAG